MPKVIQLSWKDIYDECSFVAKRQDKKAYKNIYGILQGGSVPAVILSTIMDLPLTDKPKVGETLVVDDLVDNGTTALRYIEQGFEVDCLYRKPHSPIEIAPTAKTLDGWIHFPWEPSQQGAPEDSVRRILQFIGEDPNREGLLKTPHRVTKAFREMTAGYDMDVAEILSTVFTEKYDQMVVLQGIEFVSMCEHHMLPFKGIASVGYIPNGKVVGLSKLARVTEAYARRLQVQERMTEQIATALWDHLNPLGVGVLIRSHHSCMGMRGIKKADATMVTSDLRGVIKHSEQARDEFLRLAHAGVQKEIL